MGFGAGRDLGSSLPRHACSRAALVGYKEELPNYTQLWLAWGGSRGPDVRTGPFSELKTVINGGWPLSSPYFLL